MSGLHLEIQWLVLAPAAVPALAAAAVLLLDAALPRRERPVLAAGMLGLGIALSVAAWQAWQARHGYPTVSLCPPLESTTELVSGGGGVAPSCLVQVSAGGSLLQVTAALGGLGALALLARSARAKGDSPDLAIPIVLVLATVCGAAVVAGARDLGSWLIGLELATVPVVAFIALRARRSGADAMPLLTTAVLSFALAAVGAALWVTGTGTIRLSPAVAWMSGLPGEETVGISTTPPSATSAVVALALVLLIASVAFKLALAPFHLWAPPTYARATPAGTVLLVGVSSVAALGALLVLISAASAAPTRPSTGLVLGLLAAVSMIGGAIMALRQDDPVRLLAWSGVTQSGWVVAPLVSGRADGASAAAGYLVIYVSAATLAFVVSAVVGRRLGDHAGLLRRSPLLGAGLALALLTLAGLPPAIGGLVAKVAVLRALAADGQWALIAVAVVAAVIAIAAYLRWLAVLVGPPKGPSETPGRATTIVVMIALAVVVLLALAPALVLGLPT
ncbi:proton-conducting transporter membrane subunit [Janibacter sp. GXQ6167]|uniref:proton-conducting transporter transmembrane domain-containing protein n=1 Tax=Janibacter sp. GXQ6167 TaxID=3240791 RepID=UPI003524619F